MNHRCLVLLNWCCAGFCEWGQNNTVEGFERLVFSLIKFILENWLCMYHYLSFWPTYCPDLLCHVMVYYQNRIEFVLEMVVHKITPLLPQIFPVFPNLQHTSETRTVRQSVHAPGFGLVACVRDSGSRPEYTILRDIVTNKVKKSLAVCSLYTNSQIQCRLE